MWSIYIMDKGSVKCDIRKWKFYEFWEQKKVMWVKWEKILIFAALLEVNPKYFLKIMNNRTTTFLG